MKKIKIGYKDYKLLEQEECVMNYHGCTDSVKDFIIVNKSTSLDEQLDTFIHEILHAIYYTYHILPEDDEERTVAMLAHGLTAAFKDNKGLLNKLQTMLNIK